MRTSRHPPPPVLLNGMGMIRLFQVGVPATLALGDSPNRKSVRKGATDWKGAPRHTFFKADPMDRVCPKRS